MTSLETELINCSVLKSNGFNKILNPLIRNLHCRYRTSYSDLYLIYNDRSIAVENGKVIKERGQ